jgi:branched-chain amino acid transport system permease protein
VTGAETTAARTSGRTHRDIARRRVRAHAAAGAALMVVTLFGAPAVLSTYWLDVLTEVSVYTIVCLGLGVLIGRVGLVSLCQAAILGLGAWISARLLFATSLPFALVLLIAGAGTALLGTLLGLPALRLSGLYLALITLMLAGAVTVVLTNTQFPNGGPGLLAHTDATTGSAIRRPDLGQSDPGYFRYAVVVAAMLALLALAHVRSKPGRAWAAIRQSEAAAIAAGVNITLYKLWALALASFVTGVAGGLLAGDVGHLYVVQFPAIANILLLAAILMGGVYSLWGAVVAGMLMKLLPALLDNWGLPADVLTILFGVGILQVLLTAPGGLAAQVPRDLARLRRSIVGRTVGRNAG